MIENTAAKNLADRIEQYMYERGEYNYFESDRIHWLQNGEGKDINDRDLCVEMIANSLKYDNERLALVEYFKDELAQLDIDDESLMVAENLKDILEYTLVPLEEIIKNAEATAFKEGYYQLVYQAGDYSYSFTRDYTGLVLSDMYDVIGEAETFYKDSSLHVQFRKFDEDEKADKKNELWFNYIANEGIERCPLSFEDADITPLELELGMYKLDLAHDELVEVITRANYLQPIDEDDPQGLDINLLLADDDFAYEVYASGYKRNDRSALQLRFAALEQEYDEKVPVNEFELTLLDKKLDRFAENERRKSEEKNR